MSLAVVSLWRRASAWLLEVCLTGIHSNSGEKSSRSKGKRTELDESRNEQTKEKNIQGNEREETEKDAYIYLPARTPSLSSLLSPFFLVLVVRLPASDDASSSSAHRERRAERE